MITVTDAAVKQVQALHEEQPENSTKGLRIFVETGGCAGMQYGMTFDHPKDGDEVIEISQVRFYIDSYSRKFLEGATVDFQDGLTGAGFRIHNPNATRGCGCGSSFEPASDAHSGDA
jgi:iron-sulfur cluster assembly accessory protein